MRHASDDTPPMRMLLLGAGGYGEKWLKDFARPNVADGTIEITAVCDNDPKALAEAQRFLSLSDAHCFAEARRACDHAPADFVLISTPPWYHADHVEWALGAGLHVLCEKPIADTMAATSQIVDAARRYDRRVAFTMTHRFDQAHTTLRREVHSGGHGRLDYLTFRLTGELRRYGAWGHFRHDMPDVMLLEAAIHHFDTLRDLAGADCATVYSKAWNPPWGQYAGDSEVLAIMTFANGVKASYESTACNAVSINEYFKGYIRAEHEHATVLLDHGVVERMRYDPTGKRAVRRPGSGEAVPLVEQPKFGNVWLIDRFVDWVRGGEPMDTRLEDNIQSQAMVFAALESAKTGHEVDVQDLCRRHLLTVNAAPRR